jgi:Reverse transcriptase (RNA-dependent DNA polymerase)
VKACKDELLIVALYVDDLIFMGNNQRFIDEFKKEMKLEFEMTDLGMMRYFSVSRPNRRSREYLYLKKHTPEKFSKSSK